MNTTRLNAPLFLLCAMLLSWTNVSAYNAAPEAAAPTFFDMDKDGDGVISVEEGSYWSALARQWQRVDSNRDGSIDMQEWNALDAKALLHSSDP